MKMITKDSDYAIRALACLARQSQEFVASAEIARQEEIPLRFLRRILQALIKNKIIIAREGIKGGVKLFKPAQEITIADVIRAVQGQINISACMLRKKVCENREKCVLRQKILGIEAKLIREFEDLRVSDLLV